MSWPARLAAQTPLAASPPDTPPQDKVRGQVPLAARYAVAGEATFIPQRVFAFHSPYSGPNSLQSRNETEATQTDTLYLGARLTPRFEIYLNPEIALGHGVSSGAGLAGYTNGDLIGQPSLPEKPYIARFFARWRVPLRSAAANVPAATNVIGGNLPASRLVVTAGKFALSDHFDVNGYANNARTQFLNNAFINNLAYDKAGDTRGYTLGAMVSWVEPGFVLRLGSVAMPTEAGDPDLAYRLADAHSEQAEIELHPRLMRGVAPAIVRLLAYRNVGKMGRYRDALRERTPDTAPDLSSVRRRGAVKYGFGLNAEQALGDGGATGVFGRLGWSDGETESFCYAESDRAVSVGGQLSGARWRRPNDVIGLALAQSDLAGAHKDYLAAGGLGLSLGDGGLNYGPERILEAYYAYSLSPAATISLDFQRIQNPGFNRDRGPVSLVSARLHLTF